MEKRPERHGYSKAAIAAVLGGVALLDVMAPKGETISEGVDRLMENPLGKLAVHAVVWTTALHLLNLMPEKYDWLHQLTKLKRV